MSPHILIIDDDPAIRATLTEVLEDEGYSVAAVTNGAEGLSAVEAERPKVILLDMRMPVLDGWGFTKALRSRGISLPILVMTAAQDSQRWSQEIGAAGVLAKPFDLVDLLDVIEQALGDQRTSG
ncbi:MAG: response regulator [Oscillochloris sp.]|nr:response regulator [Oscillochloris sp.]